MKAQEVRDYIVEELNEEPRHNMTAMAEAITYVSNHTEIAARELMELLLANRPTSDGMSHSYGFHTRDGRELINLMQDKYYEYSSTN
tara:strand:+ start:2696 stop:2956 length:261 start_codon:yes stop_codon:yes gene_type:complete